MKAFINQVNMFHPTIKFIGEYSKGKTNYLDFITTLIDGELKTFFFCLNILLLISFLFQLLLIISTARKGISYSQTLRLNRIFSDNEKFDKLCNDWEK